MNAQAFPVCDLPCVNTVYEDTITVSRSMLGNCNDCPLSNISSSANAQKRVVSGLDASSTSSLLSTDCFSLVRNPQSGASQDLGEVAAEVLHEKQCSVRMTVCVDSLECTALSSPARSPMESLSCDGAAASPPLPPPPPRLLFTGSENENPCSPRLRRVELTDSDSVLRAPMKPARVRSLSTLCPGKTRRRLDFDHL